MKYVSLMVSILLTLFAFLMSMASGDISGEMSSSISQTIYQALIEPISWITLSFDTFHTIIRKLAHITEYFLMGVSWMITFHQFAWKYHFIWFLGLCIACMDEGIQLFSLDRGPSIVDVLLFDYLSFVLGVFVFLGIFHKILKRMSS